MKTSLLLVSVLLLTGSAGFAADAVPVFEKNCASCHGKDGKGETKAGRKAGTKDLTDKAYQASFTDEAALKSITEGMVDKDGSEKMKSFKDKVTSEEAVALVAYVRTFAK